MRPCLVAPTKIIAGARCSGTEGHSCRQLTPHPCCCLPQLDAWSHGAAASRCQSIQASSHSPLHGPS